MANKPPITEAAFEIVALPYRIRWAPLLFALVYVGAGAAAAYLANQRAVSVAAVFVAGLWYPVFVLVAQLGDRAPSGAETDWLRKRMDPRRPRRRLAIGGPRKAGR